MVSANVNGVRAAARRGGLTWLAHADADLILLQEVRATSEQLDKVLADAGLGQYAVAYAEADAAGRAGVAVLSRLPLQEVRIGVGASEFARCGRWVEATVDTAFGPLTAVSAYVHTGEAGTERQAEKYRFLDAMSQRLSELLARPLSASAVVGGDFNIAHRQADLKNWKGNLGKAGFLPQEQVYLDRWLASGWTDCGRAYAGDVPGPYTWWSWRGKAFDNDAGWRIDYLLASTGLAAQMRSCTVGRAETYALRWSDHAPVIAQFEVPQPATGAAEPVEFGP